MKSLLLANISLLCSGIVLSAQSEVDLPRLLASEGGRQTAISFVNSSRAERVPFLLELARSPPPEVDEHDLRVGLANAFGALKITEAVPFLLRNITLRRDVGIDLAPWIKTPGAIKVSYPAVAALIEIGPDASRAAVRTYDQALTSEERLAIVFVVSQITGVPEAKPFLSKVLFHAELERLFAQEGIKTMTR